LIYRWLADLVLVVHLAFVLFVVLGGLLALQWPRVAWLHLPAAIWGVLIEYMGWICPLTPLENSLRVRAGESAYSGDFIQHYILGAIYPQGLTRTTQWILGSIALGVNALAYGLLIRQRKIKHAGSSCVENQ